MSQGRRKPVIELLEIVPLVFSSKAECLGANQEGSVSSQGFFTLTKYIHLTTPSYAMLPALTSPMQVNRHAAEEGDV